MLVSVEVWPDEVVVRARGLQANEQPPLSTPSRRRSRRWSGTMFRADWVFVPGPPKAARSLVVRIDGSDTRIELHPDG